MNDWIGVVRALGDGWVSLHTCLGFRHGSDWIGFEINRAGLVRDRDGLHGVRVLCYLG